MSREQIAIGEWYHCYNRGVDKRVVFKHSRDYERFIALLASGNSSTPIRLDNIQQTIQQGSTLLDLVLQDVDICKHEYVDIGAYALMPNHYHLLLRVKVEGGLSKFMQKIGTAYTMYFNKAYERTGALFAGKYKVKYVTDDRYFKRVFDYIHANPAELIEAGWAQGTIRNREALKQFLTCYQYSSLPDYLCKQPDIRLNSKIISRDEVKELFDSLPSISHLLETAIDFAKKEPDW